jgi:hypothetical protein
LKAEIQLIPILSALTGENVCDLPPQVMVPLGFH